MREVRCVCAGGDRYGVRGVSLMGRCSLLVARPIAASSSSNSNESTAFMTAENKLRAPQRRREKGG